ncbi:MAG: hypothetical protein GC181_14045 [Bacteroidetes bacterium]|nr:hypothetical protein [Bacteroidota bacterium]
MSLRVLVVVIALNAFSCSNHQNQQATENQPAFPDKNFFINKTFVHGANHNLTDSCTFYFECDCCFEYLEFKRDSVVQTAFCVERTTYSSGSWEIVDSILKIHFSGKVLTMEDDDYTDEVHIVEDTLIAPWTVEYNSKRCRDHWIFTNASNSMIE